MTTYPPGSELHRLAELHEARGQLLSVSCLDSCAVASFEWGGIAFPEEMQAELAALVGRECAILRLDGIYHVRAV